MARMKKKMMRHIHDFAEKIIMVKFHLQHLTCLVSNTVKLTKNTETILENALLTNQVH